MLSLMSLDHLIFSSCTASVMSKCKRIIPKKIKVSLHYDPQTYSVNINILGVQVIPERSEVMYMNEKYLHNYSFVVKRYSRKSAYTINVECTLKEEWNNNVTFNLVFNEFLHNEYRRSFLEIHYKFCDLLNFEKFIAPRIREYGIKCPLLPGTYRFMNFTVPLDEFPNVFPYERARIDMEYTVTGTKESIISVQYYAAFKNKIH